jgi:hypothetical protein
LADVNAWLYSRVLKGETMKMYIVLYRIEKVLKPVEEPFAFICMADDTDHAEKQCINAYPDCNVVWVYKGYDINAAYVDYWEVASYD